MDKKFVTLWAFVGTAFISGTSIFAFNQHPSFMEVATVYFLSYLFFKDM